MTKSRLLYGLLLIALIVASSSIRANGTSGGGAIAVGNSSPIVQTFDSLVGTPLPAVPEGWYLSETGTGAAADGLYVLGTGSSNSGGAYSFGTSNADRALGSLGSGSVTPIHYGAKLTNTGSGPITTLAISFNGEMWRRGPGTNDRLTFSYSTNATNILADTFTPVPALDFVSPGAACPTVGGTASGATNGNTGACTVTIVGNLSGININPGSSVWIRWTDVDSAGSDDALAIDEVRITATFSSDPTPPNTSASASPSTASPGDILTLSGTIIPGFNPLSQSYTVTCDLTPIGGLPNESVSLTGPTSFSEMFNVSLDAPLGASSLVCSIVDDQSRSTGFVIPIKILLQLNDTCNARATNISSVQGSGPLSSLTGETVDVEAIVTGDFQDGLSGFYVEEPAAERDANPATSEGLFIFSSTAVNAGDRVRVRGRVAEFASSTGGLTSRLTELGNVSTVQVCSSNEPLPEPVDVTLPVDDASRWEQYEGMRVRFTQQLVVTGNVSLGQFGQLDLAPTVLYQPTHFAGDQSTWSAAADLVARSRIALDDGSTSANATLNGGTVAPYPSPGLSNANTLRVGALVNPGGDGPIPLVGVLDDRFGAYRIQPTSVVTFSNAPNPRPDTGGVASATAARVTIVSANVLNFFTTLGSRGASTAVELEHQRAKVVAELSKTGGDVIGISEMQNFANGQTSGVTYTNAALSDLTSALAAATGRNYRYIDSLDATQLAPGNVIQDNGTDAIRNAIIFDAARVTPVGYTALYYQNDQNRPSLARTFKPAAGVNAGEQTFTVVVNHFRSKGSACASGNDPFQGNCNGMRTAMAENVASWLSVNPTADPAGANRKYILVGDFNAYFGEDPIQSLLGPGRYADLSHLLLGEREYSYNFASQVGALDHALANAAALPLVKGVAHLHVNADEPAALQALDTSLKSALAQDAYYAPNEFAASDHDPLVIGFNPLSGDFNDDGRLDDNDRTALLLAVSRSEYSPVRDIDRRMDMNGDGVVTQEDFHIWQNQFISWKKHSR
jgi:predicted extracellular nuclease